MNRDLPVLPIWHARSFYASLLLAATVFCNMLDIDFLGFLTGMGLGENEDEILRNVEMLLPLIFGLWAWIERQAPNFRLTWRKAK